MKILLFNALLYLVYSLTMPPSLTSYWTIERGRRNSTIHPECSWACVGSSRKKLQINAFLQFSHIAMCENCKNTTIVKKYRNHKMQGTQIVFTQSAGGGGWAFEAAKGRDSTVWSQPY